MNAMIVAENTPPATRSTAGELTAWVKRASMANGFGDVGLCEDPFRSTVSSPHQQPASQSRSASLPDIVVAMVDAVGTRMRSWIAQWKQYQLQRATYRALGELDARTLKDMGLTRSELRSVAVELTGESEPTRAHALMRLRSLSI